MTDQAGAFLICSLTDITTLNLFCYVLKRRMVDNFTFGCKQIKSQSPSSSNCYQVKLDWNQMEA